MRQLVIFAGLALAACGPRWTSTETVRSTVSGLTFEIRKTASAGCCSNLAAVTMKHDGESTEVARARNVGTVRLHFADRRVVIEMCGASDYEAKSHVNFGIEYDERGDRIGRDLVIVTRPGISVDGRAFCVGNDGGR